MAETKPTATAAARSISSVQPKRSRNSISWLAPLTCIILGYIIWRFAIGNPGNFERPDASGYSSRTINQREEYPACPQQTK